MALIGFIGMGNMGYAMLKGALKKFAPEDIIFTCPDKAKCRKIADETGVQYAESNAECANNAKYIVLAVKPAVYPTVYKNIMNVLTEKNVVISLAPGISIDDIRKGIGLNRRVVRSMPNTPALVGEGMTGLSYDEALFDFEERDFLKKFFSSFGKVTIVPEKLMSAVVCASGSSPAYVYMFIEALADSVVACGMPRDKAYELVAQTVLGSAKMVLETKEHPGLLKDRVCSPGGTTIQGVAALEANGFRKSLFEATKECYKKCENK
ncbi:MAG: pyrroline-5-carboxylate reductase [Lachnospiraceae bacterium]